jgi:predicted ATPase/DNA-binding CsgD family transcriptional regulator/Tfp pilus assembly protein PilF
MNGVTVRLTTQHRLPTHAKPMLGREGALQSLSVFLETGARLLTLVGPAGVGKTRLGIGFAEIIAPHFPDGSRFVDLTHLHEPEAVAVAMACAFDVLEWRGTTPFEALVRRLGESKVLLVLDNFEHLLAAAPLLDGFLERCPGLSVVVTSRQALGIRHEQPVTVQPLGLPGQFEITVRQIERSSAVQLFLERARAVQPDFALTDQNAAQVAALCLQLDGLPLALELTAARVNLLPIPAMLERLRSGRPLPGTLNVQNPRHTSLHAALGWSYDLLSPHERRVLSRLGVFRGFTLEAFEAIADPEGEADALATVASLADKNFVFSAGEGETPRFRLLETVRVFALEALLSAGEHTATRQRHLGFLLALAEETERHLVGDRQTHWLEKLNAEYENFGAALEFALNQGFIVEGLRLACALQMFWRLRGYAAEGAGWLERFLAVRQPVPEPVQARGWLSLGILRSVLGSIDLAEEAVERAIALFETLNDSLNLARALTALAVVTGPRGDYVQRRKLIERALPLFQAAHNDHGVVTSLNNLGDLDRQEGHLERSRERLEQALPLARKLSDASLMAFVLNSLGLVLWDQQQLPAARTRLEEALDIRRGLGYWHMVAQTLDALGSVLALSHDLDAAEAAYNEAISLNRELGTRYSEAINLHHLAEIQDDRGRPQESLSIYQQSLALSQRLGAKLLSVASLEKVASLLATAGQPEDASSILGCAQAQREALKFVRDKSDESEMVELTSKLRLDLSAVIFENLLAQGRALSLEAVIAQAQGIRLKPNPPTETSARAMGLTPLSPREDQVLRLAAEGMSNKQIGRQLEISERTVRFHVTSVFNKLGVNSRTQAVAEAGKLGLL